VNRLAERLTHIENNKLLVPFFTAGFPTLSTSLELAKVAEDAGADIVELGMPFSDPLADGPDIQFSSQIALENKVNLGKILEGVGRLRARLALPIVLMGYFNPILIYGVERFLHSAAERGVDGLIIPDLPVEEADGFRQFAVAEGLSLIFLVAPTSSPERIRMIDRASSDLVYAVTVTGVTGTGKKFDRSTNSYLKNLRRQLSRPFVAGFGVSTVDDARRMVRYADGVVIGSALIRLLRQAKNRSDGLRKTESFLRKIKRAIS